MAAEQDNTCLYAQVFSSWPALHILTIEKTSLIFLVKINCPFAYSYAFKIALFPSAFLKSQSFFVYLSHKGFSKYLLNDTSLFLLQMLTKPEV